MDLSTYFGRMDILKNDIFSTGPPCSGCGDGGVALGLSPFFLSLELPAHIFWYVSGKSTRTQGALRWEGGPDYILRRTQSFAARKATLL